MSQIADVSTNELIRMCIVSRTDELWAEFLRRYRPCIASAVFLSAQSLFVLGKTEVEDLIQDVLAALLLDDRKLLVNFKSSNEKAFRAYLRKISSHIALDKLREQNADKRGGEVIHTSLDQDSSVSIVDEEPPKKIIDGLLLQQVEAFVATYPPRERTLFWLYHRHGYTTTQIAGIAQLGVTNTQVDSILRKLERNIEKRFGNSVAQNPAAIRLGKGGDD